MEKKKKIAREKVRYAIRKGTLKREPCEVCGVEESEGHHTDYSKPLEVKWLCKKHHDEVHKDRVRTSLRHRF